MPHAVLNLCRLAEAIASMKSHNCFSCLLSIHATLFWLPQIASSQISDAEILSLLSQNQFAVAQERVLAAYQKDPNSPIAVYYRAVLEDNAEAATSSFQDVARRFKGSEYAERALYRLGQYHFARGSYLRGRQFFQELLASYPRSPQAGAAAYFAAKALMVSGQPAGEELQDITQKYPGTWMAEFAQEDLSKLSVVTPAATEIARGVPAKKPEEKPQQPGARQDNPRYAVQVGAFSDKQRAQELERRFKGSSYKTELHERKEATRKYYLVWVGSFSQREEAWDCANELRKKYSVKPHVVRRDD